MKESIYSIDPLMKPTLTDQLGQELIEEEDREEVVEMETVLV